MAESGLTWKNDNNFVPPFVPKDLKWLKKDGLETQYGRNKCEEFLENTDLHFKQRKIINFGMIKNDQQQIISSIFHNANRKDMNIEKRTINEHFSNKKNFWMWTQ